MDGSRGTLRVMILLIRSPLPSVPPVSSAEWQAAQVGCQSIHHLLGYWLYVSLTSASASLMWWLVTEKHLRAPSCLCSCALFTPQIFRLMPPAAVLWWLCSGEFRHRWTRARVQRTARQFCGVALQKLFAFKSHCESLPSDWSRACILGDLRI